MEMVIGRDIGGTLGTVRGNTTRARNVGRDITQGLRSTVGGELRSYTGLMAEAHDGATDRMVTEAEAMGTDAVVNVRYVIAEMAQGAAEILAYETAVTLVDGTGPDADAGPAPESSANVA